jgi:hypothetical protein
MRSQRLWRMSLRVAGILQLGMVVAHLGLQYEWAGFDFGPLPAQLAWALLALNFSWTILLLAVAGLVLYIARVGAGNPFARRFVFVVGLFWTVHGAYVWLEPMPLPPRLQWLAFVLAAFPATLILLHWIPLAATRHLAAHTGVVPAVGGPQRS